MVSARFGDKVRGELCSARRAACTADAQGQLMGSSFNQLCQACSAWARSWSAANRW